MERGRGIVALFGGTGFVGRHVAAALAASGWTVRAFARSAPAGTGVRPLDAVNASEAELAQAIAGCVAVVNAIGIKRPDATQDFEAAHVAFPRRLVAACHSAQVDRLVHVSVGSARADGPHEYHRSKGRGDAVVADSGLRWTILRPSVIWGPGDDMVAHLAKMVRASPVFPVVGRGATLMQPVHVDDVAQAVVAALAAQAPVGRTIDVVGPERLALREIVGRVADAMEMPTRILPVPAPLMVLPSAMMTRFAERPLTTTGQLAILREGLTGDGTAARDLLGLAPRPFTPEAVRPVLPPLGRHLVDLRFGRRRPVLPLLPVGVAVLLGLLALVVGFRGGFGDLWFRLVGSLVAAGVLAGIVGRRHLVDAWRPTPWMLALGAVIGIGLYAASWAMALVPSVADHVGQVLELQAGHPAWLVVPMLAAAVVAEEVLWRGVVAGGLAGRMPAWAAVLLSAALYSAGHLASGSPLLIGAAFGLGLLWGALFLATRSLAATSLCHVTWEVLAAVLFPVA